MEWVVYASVVCLDNADHNVTNNYEHDRRLDWLKEPSTHNYETIFSEFLMKQAFPTSVCEQPTDREFLGHHQVLMQKIQMIQQDMNIFGIPRTLYELLFLREYLYHRVATAFRVMDDDVSFLEEYGISFTISPWIFDHRTFSGTITYQTFCDKVFKRTNLENNPRLAFTYYEMNNLVIKHVIQAVHKINGLQTKQDIITDNGTLSSTILRIIFEQVVNDLVALQQGQQTDISQSYDMWPLQSETLMDTLENDFVDCMSEWQPSYERILQQSKSLQKSITELIKLIKSSNQQDNESVVAFLQQFQERLLEFGWYGKSNDNLGNPLASTIAQELWSTALELCHDVKCHIGYYLASSSYGTSQVIQALKKLKRYLDPVYAVDPCVYSFRKPSFISRQPWSGNSSTSSIDTIWNCIQMETQSYQSGTFLLYRGTANLEHDSMFVQVIEGSDGSTTKSTASNPSLTHSLSFGMSLFSGILFDKTATVYNKLRKSNMKGYAVQIPISPFLALSDNKELKPSDLVFVPPLPCLLQLAGLGELFHPRTKLWIPSEWKDCRQYFVSGVHHMCYQQVPDFLRIAEGVTKEDVISAHNQLKYQLALIK